MRLWWAASCFALVWLSTALAATISGTVTDSSGKAIKDARIDHIGDGKQVVNFGPQGHPQGWEDGPRSDANGRFQLTITAPAIVIRKPGYESQRITVNRDGQVQIVLQPIKPLTCKVDHLPPVKTKPANDVDYTATWYYVETKNGPKGVLSGRGLDFSWGAPSYTDVWTSTDYFEVMYDNGVIDARGQKSDGKYWRSQSIFGAAAFYFGLDQATAEILDCVMNRVLVKSP